MSAHRPAQGFSGKKFVLILFIILIICTVLALYAAFSFIGHDSPYPSNDNDRTASIQMDLADKLAGQNRN